MNPELGGGYIGPVESTFVNLNLLYWSYECDVTSIDLSPTMKIVRTCTFGINC